MNKPNNETCGVLEDARMEIASVVEKEMEEKEISLRKLARLVEEKFSENGKIKTPHYNTIQKIKTGNNYTIDSLLMVLDMLNKKIKIIDKK